MAAIGKATSVDQLEKADTHQAIEDGKDLVNGHIILRPLPSNDPNDPLIWSSRDKFTTYLTVCFFAFLATANASNLVPAVVPLAKEFHKNSTQTGYLVCFNILMLGVGSLFWVPLMRYLGKRPVYLIALTLLCVSNVWSYESKSYGSLLGSRIVSGFAAAAGDAPVPSVASDLFYVHERGAALMIYHLAISCGYFVGPLINGYVVQYAGWQWTCGWIAIAAGFTMILSFFTLFETTYHRGDVEAPAETYQPRYSYRQSLSITRGYKVSPDGFFKSLLTIFEMTLYPAVTWAGFCVGTFVGWNIVVQLTSARTFSAKPYHWKTGTTGLLNVSGFIGALAAFFIGGKLIDVVSNRMTARANGRREPEYRLTGIVIPAIIGPMGILLFGLIIAEKGDWVGAAFGYGMQGFGLTAASNVAVSYAVDSYLPFAGEALTVIFVIRNVIGVILSLFFTNWREATGTRNVFGEMVGIPYFVLLLCIAFFLRGRQIRQWTNTFGPMKRVIHEF